MCIDMKMEFCLRGTIYHWLKGKHNFTFSQILRVILKELHHSELEQNGINIFMLLSELFLIAAYSEIFLPFSRQDGSKHI